MCVCVCVCVSGCGRVCMIIISPQLLLRHWIRLKGCVCEHMHGPTKNEQWRREREWQMSDVMERTCGWVACFTNDWDTSGSRHVRVHMCKVCLTWSKPVTLTKHSAQRLHGGDLHVLNVGMIETQQRRSEGVESARRDLRVIMLPQCNRELNEKEKEKCTMR